MARMFGLSLSNLQQDAPTPALFPNDTLAMKDTSVSFIASHFHTTNLKRVSNGYCLQWWNPPSHPFLSVTCVVYQKRTVKKSQTEKPKPKKDSDIVRERIIRRAALEFEDGMYGILYWARFARLDEYISVGGACSTAVAKAF